MWMKKISQTNNGRRPEKVPCYQGRAAVELILPENCAQLFLHFLLRRILGEHQFAD